MIAQHNEHAFSKQVVSSTSHGKHRKCFNQRVVWSEFHSKKLTPAAIWRMDGRGTGVEAEAQLGGYCGPPDKEDGGA